MSIRWLYIAALLNLAILLFACEDDKVVIWGGGGCFDCATIDDYPVWSPDGKLIAYNRRNATYLIQPDGFNNRLWYDSPIKPVWSPDGQWIVFSENSQIWKKSIDGEITIQLTFEMNNINPAWSPDGKNITFYRSPVPLPHLLNDWAGIEEMGMWLLDLENNIERRIYSGFIEAHVWIDNKNILWTQNYYEENNFGAHFYLLDIEMQEKHIIADLPKVSVSPRSVNHTNRDFKILFSQHAYNNRTDCGRYDLWLINDDGTECRKLFEYVSSASWSPDGAHIVYSDCRFSNGYLWILDLAEGSKRQLTFENQF